MNHAKWIKLTPLKQRIKIATLDGWIDIHMLDNGVPYGWHPQEHPKKTNRYETPLPNYLHDLNAMHIAEIRIASDDLISTRWLANILRITGGTEQSIRATTEQRAEAFVLAMEPEPKKKVKQ